MPPLPEADPDTAVFFHAWLDTFAAHVRSVDYAAARPLFHPDVLAFGTHNDVVAGLPAWVATQWDNVWPKTTGFRFTAEHVHILASADGTMATVIAPWTSTGYHPDGTAFDRLAVRPLPHVPQPRRAPSQPRQPTRQGAVAASRSRRASYARRCTIAIRNSRVPSAVPRPIRSPTAWAR